MSAVDTAAPTTTGAVWDELVSELPVGVLLLDELGEVLAANGVAPDLLGLSRDELLRGRRPAGWVGCDDSGSPLPEPGETAAQVLRANTRLTVPVLIVVNEVPHSRLLAEFHPVTHR